VAELTLELSNLLAENIPATISGAKKRLIKIGF
jgi:hypothetical protein